MSRTDKNKNSLRVEEVAILEDSKYFGNRAVDALNLQLDWQRVQKLLIDFTDGKDLKINE